MMPGKEKKACMGFIALFILAAFILAACGGEDNRPDCLTSDNWWPIAQELDAAWVAAGFHNATYYRPDHPEGYGAFFDEDIIEMYWFWPTVTDADARKITYYVRTEEWKYENLTVDEINAFDNAWHSVEHPR